MIIMTGSDPTTGAPPVLTQSVAERKANLTTHTQSVVTTEITTTVLEAASIQNITISYIVRILSK